mgnify:CR=1 FL=1
MIPGRQAISGFDPNSIPGLTLWMDAADANTITTFGTGRIGIWADKSSNRYGFSNYVTGPSYTQTQNGLNVVTFTASNATDPSGQCLFKFVGSLPMSLSSHAVFAVHKPDLTTGTNYGDNNLLVLRAGTDQLRFPATISGSFSGTAKVFEESFRDQPLLILAAVITIYIVLGCLYESFIHPLTILSALPFAGFGALLEEAIGAGIPPTAF